MSQINLNQTAATAVDTPPSGYTTIFSPDGITLAIKDSDDDVTYLAGSGINAVTAVGSSPNANAATVSGHTLNLEPASITYPGVVIAGPQTFSGRKVIQAQGDNVPLTLQASSAQTANTLEIKNSSGTVLSAIGPAGKIGAGKSTPGAYVDIAAGTTSVPPLRLTSGTNLTSATAGAVEYDGVNLYYTDGTPIRRKIQAPDPTKYGPLLFDDFIANNAAGNIGWDSTNSGTGSAPSTSASYSDAFNRAMGCLLLTTGTTTAGRSCVHLGQTMGWGYAVIYNRWRLLIGNLSDGTDTFQVTFGYGDTVSGNNINQTNGVRFIYDTSLSNNWVCQTIQGGTATTTLTTVPVAAGSMINFEITGNAGTNVVFTIGGTTVATHTTNLPGFLQFLGPLVKINKTAGTTARSMLVDYFWQQFYLTGTR